MANSTRTPSFAPSIIPVSSAPKHTGQAKALELPPITMAAAARARTIPTRIDVIFIAVSSSCAGTIGRRRLGLTTWRKPRQPRKGIRPPRSPARTGSNTRARRTRRASPRGGSRMREPTVGSSMNPEAIVDGDDGQDHEGDEEGPGQREDRVDQLLFRDQVHEVARDQRSLDDGDDQRHGHGQRHGKMEARHRHGDDGQDHQRDEDGDVDPDVLVDVDCVIAGHGCRRVVTRHGCCLQKIPLYKKYSAGKSKIQTRSTKCQKRPAFSTRLVNHTGFVFHSLAPGPQKYAFTTIPPNTCSPCRPVKV